MTPTTFCAVTSPSEPPQPPDLAWLGPRTSLTMSHKKTPWLITNWPTLYSNYFHVLHFEYTFAIFLITIHASSVQTERTCHGTASFQAPDLGPSSIPSPEFVHFVLFLYTCPFCTISCTPFFIQQQHLLTALSMLFYALLDHTS